METGTELNLKKNGTPFCTKTLLNINEAITEKIYSITMIRMIKNDFNLQHVEILI